MHKVWSYTLNLNIKGLDNPVASVCMPQLIQVIWKNTLKKKHQGLRYPCDQCEYVATEVHNLKLHIDSKHEGVRYPCDHCDYAATQACVLKKHIENKHEGVRFPCLRCVYHLLQQQQVIWRNTLNLNMKEWDICAINVNFLQPTQVVWGDIQKLSMKEWRIPAISVNTFPPNPVI